MVFRAISGSGTKALRHSFIRNRFYSQIPLNVSLIRHHLLRNTNLSENLASCEYLNDALLNSTEKLIEKVFDFKELYLLKLLSIITSTNHLNSNERCLKYLTGVLKIDNTFFSKKDIVQLLSQILMKHTLNIDAKSKDNLFLKDIIGYILIMSDDIESVHPQVIFSVLKYLHTLPATEENIGFSNKIILPILNQKLYLKTPFYTSLLIDVLTKQKRLKTIQQLLPTVSELLVDKNQLHLKLFDIFVALGDETNLKELMPILAPTVAKFPLVMAYVVKNSDDPISKLTELQHELKNNVNIIEYLIFSSDLMANLTERHEKLSSKYLEEYLRLLNINLRLNMNEKMFEAYEERLLYFKWKTYAGSLISLLLLKKNMLAECIDFVYNNSDLTSLVTAANVDKISAMIERKLQKSKNVLLKKRFAKVKNVLSKRLNGETLVNRHHDRSFYLQDY